MTGLKNSIKFKYRSSLQLFLQFAEKNWKGCKRFKAYYHSSDQANPRHQKPLLFQVQKIKYWNELDRNIFWKNCLVHQSKSEGSLYFLCR